MNTKSRREREREERRERILMAAQTIVAEEGILALSMRKIAQKIGYSPAIIYHYFANKEQILDHLLQQGYQRILRTLAGSEQENTALPLERIEQTFRRYIAMALENPDYFKAFILNDSPAILERTAVLFEGASATRPSLAQLARDLSLLAPGRDNAWIELTAQVLWSSLFGLTVRLLIERDLPAAQREKLIDRYVEVLQKSLSSQK